MNTVYFIRHGESEVNITHEFSHQLIDKGLTPKGYIQSKQTADTFRFLEVDYLYSSPLQRALDTARILAQSVKIKPEIVGSFREINIGAFETPPDPPDEKWKRFFNVTRRWLKHTTNTELPEGESFLSFIDRVKAGLIDILSGINDKTVIIVTHSGVIQFTLPYIFPQSISEHLMDQDILNGSITKMRISFKKGKFHSKLDYWMNIKHLSGLAAQFEPGLTI